MEISELKPVTKTYVQFRVDPMDNPTEVKNVLNKYMAFGQVHAVVESINDEGKMSYEILYIRSVIKPAYEHDLEINSLVMKGTCLIINDFDKQITTLKHNTGILSTAEGKVKFIEENNHKVFLLPKGGVAVTDSNTTI